MNVYLLCVSVTSQILFEARVITYHFADPGLIVDVKLLVFLQRSF